MSIYFKSISLTLLIFLIGIMIGILIESFRIGAIKKSISENEIYWRDITLLSTYIGRMEKEYCDMAFEENLAYNSRIYEFGSQIERQIEASPLTPEAKQEWRRYVLLQFQFWLNSIELKEKCNFTYSNVVYLARSSEDLTSEEKAENRLQSKILLNLKEKCGRGMMLIPLTADVNLETIDLVLRKFNITKFPAVIIDEKYVFQGLTPTEELEKYIKC